MVQRAQNLQQAQQAVQTAVSSGAVVVQLSSSDANRSTSKGTSKEQVDPTFAKERVKEEVSKSKEESKRNGKSVDISA